MNYSYFTYDQVCQMQVALDILTMFKVLHEAGFDLSKETKEVKYVEWGDQFTVFEHCLHYLSDFEMIEDEFDVRSYKLKILEINNLSDEKKNELTKRMKDVECNYFGELIMNGVLDDNHLHFNLYGYENTFFSNFLRVIVGVYKEIIHTNKN